MAVKPSAEDLQRFREVSPIAHVGAVTAPLLFMLGAKDRRWGATPCLLLSCAPSACCSVPQVCNVFDGLLQCPASRSSCGQLGVGQHGA